MSAELERYRELLAAAPLGCLLVEGGTVREANAEALETLGIPEDRMLGVELAELLLPDFAEACAGLLDRVAASPEAGSVSEPVRLARGLAPIELRARSLADGWAMVGVRCMAAEHKYSAQAGGALTHDLVTGFPDHFHVLSQLDDRLSAPNRRPMALLCLWIDDLPGIAESHGMRAVHRIMRETGNRLKDRLRAPDILGRFEESGFLVMISTDADPAQLTTIGERLRDEVAFPVELDRGLVSFTTSLVVGSVTSSQVSIERVLAQLDAAADRAVNSGGCRTDYLSI
jgi:diguanylate cyclase (GGDEF)-like protein